MLIAYNLFQFVSLLLLSVVFCSERAMTPRYWHAKLGEVELKASSLCVVVVRHD